jgi:hypothetical protein
VAFAKVWMVAGKILVFAEDYYTTRIGFLPRIDEAIGYYASHTLAQLRMSSRKTILINMTAPMTGQY